MMKRIFGLLLGLLVAAAALGTAGNTGVAKQKPPVVTAVNVERDGDLTRFTAQLSYAVGFDVYVLSDPFRVVLDLPDIGFSAPEDRKPPSGSLIESYRFGRMDAERSRIVLDAAGPVLIERSYIERETEELPAKLVVELISVDRKEFDRLRTAEQPAPPPAPAADVAETRTPLPDAPGASQKTLLEAAQEQVRAAIESLQATEPVPIPQPRPTRTAETSKPKPKPARPANARRVVVIDPGHGGIDPGAVSKRGTKEKSIVLEFSRTLRDKLKKTGRFDVIMTRDGDDFVSLRDRVRIARKNAADLFIAVHADSIRGRGATGATIYTVSEKASDAEAAALAKKENRADIIAGVNLDEENDDITGILIDLAQRETNNYSTFFAKKVLGQMKKVTRMHSRPLRSAGFRVLKAPDVPSILLELGYLSSKTDERRLKSSAWRNKTAAAIAKAIDSYFSTRLAAQN